MSESGHSDTMVAPREDRVRAVLVPLTLLALAALLWPNWWGFTSPVSEPTSVPAWATSVATVRAPVLRPEVKVGAFTYRCNECHKLFPSPSGKITYPLYQHRDIVLKHGINDHCFNCHHRSDRNAYVDNQGNPIPADQPQLLCAKCHGPVYRDWTHGVHGRTDGYWNSSLGPLVRKKCIECHDPHVPPFPPMHPAPGPNTLRMGDQHSYPSHAEARKNPLLIYRRSTPDGQTHGEAD